MIRRSSLIAAEIILALFAAVLIGLGVAWWRLSQGPVELNFLKQHVEYELSRARSGRPVSIERVLLAWSRSGGALELHAEGVTIKDAAGHPLTRFNDARIELGAAPLVVGQVSLEEADFSGGEVSITRKQDGRVEIACGPPGSAPDIVLRAPPTNETLEQRVARLLDGLEAAFRPVGPGGKLRSIAIHGAHLSIADESGGGRWTADSSDFELARADRALALSADARLEGAQGLAPATLRITTDTAFQSAIVEFGARDVRPRALLSPAALGPFAGLDAPLTANISLGLDRHSGVNRIEGEATLGRGVAQMEGGQFTVNGGRIHGRYDVQGDELIIDQLSLAGARTHIRGEIHVHNASNILRAQPNHPAPFDIAMPSLTMEAPGVFVEPVSVSDVQAEGAIDAADHSIRFSHFQARADNSVADGSARWYWAAAPDHRVHAGVQMDATISGDVDARTILRLWPMQLAAGVHDYLWHSITGGRVRDAVVHLDVRPSDSAAEIWRDAAADVNFNLANAEMRFIQTMSPVTNGIASAHVGGNSFRLTMQSGRFNDLAVTRGEVNIPHLKPHGQPLMVSAHVEGDARRIVEVLMQRPLDLRDRLPVDPASVTGHGAVNLSITRPMLPEVPFELYRFSVDGHVDNFAGNMSTKHVALSQGALNVRGDERAIRVTGPIHAGTSNVNVAWTEWLNRRGRASSEYQISGDFDSDDLVRLGYGLASYAEGRVGVTVNGQGRGFDVDQAHVEVDLRRAAVESPWLFWTKNANVAAAAHFDVARQSDNTIAFNNLEVRGSGVLAQGRVRAQRDGRIAEADLTHLVVDGRSDAHVTMQRGRDGGLEVAVRGALFDGAPFMASDSHHSSGGGAGPTRPADEPLVRANVAVDRLKLRGGATLANARVAVVVQHDALELLTAEGQSPGNKPFTLALGVRPDDPQGGVRLRSEDAGFAMRALTGTENIVGGTALADGDWRVGPPSVSHFTVHLRNFQVVRLPAMAQLLSSAGSLTGLVEMLNGDGIGFTALDAPMIYTDGRLAIGEARLAGPSLGLTGTGAYNIDDDNLHVNGVVVPSYGVNSMLGALPVIGDLFVSRRGEGVVGMTYTVNGHVAEPRVMVNPLSALTPGILRRIFEPPTPHQHAAPAAPAAPPPRSEAQATTQPAVSSSP